MRRRAFLATAIAASFAGCDGDGDEPTETETVTDTEGPIQSPTATDTPDSTPTDTPTETASDTPTETPTLADPLDRYEARLTAVLDIYVPDGASFADVDSSHRNVDTEAMRVALEEARTTKQTLEGQDLSGDRQDRFNDLNGVFNMLWYARQVHEHLVTAWERHREAFEAVLTQSGGPSRTIDSITAAVDEANVDRNSMLAESNAADLESFSALLTSDYNAKNETFSAEITGFREMVSALDTMRSGMNTFDTGTVRYENAEYTPASIEFNDAANTFSGLESTFSGGWRDSMSRTATDGACVAGAMAAGSSRMDTVSQSVGGGNDDPEAAKGTARDEFEQCELVFQDVAVVKNFYE